MKIRQVEAFQIFDSRGVPTVEAHVTLEDGTRGVGVAPSGASTGQFEALELRDRATRFRGKSVFKAIEHIHSELAPAIAGKGVFEQERLDRLMIELDGTPNKSRLGANAILPVSMAIANAATNARKVPLFASLGDGNVLPIPEIQIVGGGAHANWRTDVQDFLLIANGATSFEQTLEITHDVFHAAGDLMRKRGTYFGVADEGGYWPQFDRNEDAIAFVVEAIISAGYTPGKDAAIALDIAASDLFDESSQRYSFKLENRTFTSDEFCHLISGWCDKYPIISIEDPLADTDWTGWQKITQRLGKRIQLVGDDLFTTNVARIREGIEKKVANAVLIKLNQIGTVTETIEAIHLTQKAGYQPIVSARSGETEDAFISHLAVATNAGQLKVGSFSRTERMVKWNEVLRIQRHLGTSASYNGFSALKG
jgi:enolase